MRIYVSISLNFDLQRDWGLICFTTVASKPNTTPDTWQPSNGWMSKRMKDKWMDAWQAGQVYKVNSIPHSLTCNLNHSPGTSGGLPWSRNICESPAISHPRHLSLWSSVLLDSGNTAEPKPDQSSPTTPEILWHGCSSFSWCYDRSQKRPKSFCTLQGAA